MELRDVAGAGSGPSVLSEPSRLFQEQHTATPAVYQAPLLCHMCWQPQGVPIALGIIVFFARRRTYRARAEQAEADLAAERARSATLQRHLAACQQQLTACQQNLAASQQQLMDYELKLAALEGRLQYMEQRRGSSAGSTEDVEVPAAPGGPQPQQAASAAAGAAQPAEPAAALCAGREELAGAMQGDQTVLLVSDVHRFAVPTLSTALDDTLLGG